MAAQPALPLLAPTVPGCVEGIISLDPRVLQCQECGATADADSVGLSVTGRQNPAMVHLLSGLHFHPLPWSGGQTDNPRLCRDCRMARSCDCMRCEDERRGA